MLSIFLEASKVILDVVFLYFRLLAFVIDIFHTVYVWEKYWFVKKYAGMSHRKVQLRCTTPNHLRSEICF